MSKSTRSDFVDFIVPLWKRLELYDKTSKPDNQPKNDAADAAKNIPQGFIDAMDVRVQVFVEEQGVPLENELDDDDQKSFHWVAYASVPAKYSSNDSKPCDEKMESRRPSTGTSTKVPIGTIRMVPMPQPVHPNGKWETAVQKSSEGYVKLGRLSVTKEFRKAGISNLLINTALQFAREHPDELLPSMDPSMLEHYKQKGMVLDYYGLVLVHAQKGVQKVWQKYGFETDESMGTWDEEGIEHVGMWKRVDLATGRRGSGKVTLSGYAAHR